MPFKSSARGSYGPQGQKVIKGPLAPVWVTFSPGPVGTDAFSYTFVATDDSGDTPTYSVASGSLPNGLNLNSSTGVLSGTATVSGTFTYTLRATDVNGRSTDTTSISQTVSLSLYAFTSATFTTGGVTGRNGPDITQARAGLGNPSWAPTYLDMTTNGIQRWTVPGTGSYSFVVAGSRGGTNNRTGGAGRIITGTVSLTQGEVLNIVCGQSSNDSTSSGSGGGGGSFVYRGPSTSTTEENLLFAAGGGSGFIVGSPQNDGDTAPASIAPSAGIATGSPFDSSVSSGGNGGILNSHNNYGGGPGAGFFTKGPEPRTSSGNQSGGGYAGNTASGGWVGGQRYNLGTEGGFGGGGSAADNCGGTGGGGGYNGGTGQSCYMVSGAGGSKWGASVSNGAYGSTNNGAGYVTITKL